YVCHNILSPHTKTHIKLSMFMFYICTLDGGIHNIVRLIDWIAGLVPPAYFGYATKISSQGVCCMLRLRVKMMALMMRTMRIKQMMLQLSKKELKKKELAELDAVLAELGLGTSNNSIQEEPNGKKISMKTEETQFGCFLYDDAESSVAGKKGADQVADGEKKEDSSKELKEAQDQANGLEAAAMVKNISEY
ncbi:hypothetical protein ACJX0J_034125, partial [Zea mays]